MPEEYTALVTALKGTGIPFAEYGWETAPRGSYGVVSLEFEPDALTGDDRKKERAYEGSIDIFCRRLDERSGLITLVENVLEENVGASWRLNSMQHESGTGYFHFEWVFQVER